jgi:hypothetical protein
MTAGVAAHAMKLERSASSLEQTSGASRYEQGFRTNDDT